ncbi:MAG: ABC transporter permease [Phycisphaerae bacterium]
MRALLQDLRYAFRMLANRPGFTTVVIITLALGIGANTAIFSVVNAVVLRPLPFEKPRDLVVVLEMEGGQAEESAVSYPNFQDWRSQNHVFEDIAVFRGHSFTLTSLDDAKRVTGARVSSGFFPLLRVEPLAGRTFEPEDDLPGAENVAVVSNSFWRSHLGEDRSAVGETLTLDGDTFTLVGVLPSGFKFPIALTDAEIWQPVALDADFFEKRGLHLTRAIARLKPDTSLAQAQSEMDTIASGLEQQFPDSNRGWGVKLASLHEQVVGEVRPAAMVLLGAVGMVLLIACANVANLLLTRSSTRAREFGIRAALGAGRTRIIRQLLTESLVLSAVGGAVGLVLGLWGTTALGSLLPADVPRSHEVGFDGYVLGFALILSVLTGLLFGLAPAIHGSRTNLHESVKQGTRRVTASGGHRLRSALVVSEIAIALVLLIGAGLLMRSFQRLLTADLGFDPRDMLTFRMSVPFSGYSNPGERAELYRQIVERTSQLPGVESASATSTLPLSGSAVELTFGIEGRPVPPGGEEYAARFNSVSPQYFHTTRIPLLRGRLPNEQDCAGSAGVIVVNERLASRYWPDDDPLGKRIISPIRFGDEDPRSFEIIGVVGNVRHWSVDAEGIPTIYLAYTQQTWPFTSFVLKTNVPPETLIGAVRAEVSAITATEAAYRFRTMDQYIAKSVSSRRTPMLLLALFAGTALILAAIGIYGVISYSVTQRTHEIGVRVTLGAQPLEVTRLILKQGLTVTALGLGIGVAVSLAAARTLSSQLYEIGTMDPITLVAVPLLLAIVALTACYIPARRATKVDPMVALRCE